MIVDVVPDDDIDYRHRRRRRSGADRLPRLVLGLADRGVDSAARARGRTGRHELGVDQLRQVLRSEVLRSATGAESSTEDSRIAKKTVELANEIQTTAWPILPTTLNNDPEVVGGNVTNVGISPMFGTADLITLAVKK